MNRWIVNHLLAIGVPAINAANVEHADRLRTLVERLDWRYLQKTYIRIL